jgi:hypothetical protein
MKKIVSIIFALSILFNCSTDDLKKCDKSVCDKCVIISKELYNQTNTENYIIDNAIIVDDCLEVVISSSGCDGNSWKIELFDLAAISESNPIQRNLKIKLTNSEDCLAFITKQISFDIKQLRTNDNQILLDLEKWEELILYSY